MRRGLSRLRSVVAQVAYQSGGVPTNSSRLPQRAAEPSTWASAQSTGRSQFGTTPAEARTAKDRARRAQRSKQQQEVQQRLHAESSVNGSVTASAQQQPQPPASRARMVRAAAARVNGSGNSSSLGSSFGGPSNRSPPAAAAAASASSGDASNTAARSSSGSFSSPSSSPIAHAAGWPATGRPSAAAAAGRTAAPGGYASASPSPAAAGGNGAPVAPSRQQQAATQWTPQPRSTAALVEELHAGNGSSSGSSSSSSLHSEVASTSTSPEAGISAEQIAQTYKNEPPPDVHVVNTLAGARAAAAQLMALVDAPQHGGQPLIFACDTEVMDIDVSSHSPCCHGRVICFSVYAGPSVHFGEQAPPAGAPLRSMLWVDTWLDGDEARAEEAAAIVDTFRPFWESERHKKVWHNYSFDRHVMERLGVGMAGFDGDTMHMARLWDSSRGSGRGGYSLEALSSDRSLMDDGSGGEQDIRGKVSMKTLFGRRNLKKDGTEGKLTILPPVHELQRDAATRWRWVNYSAFDAKSTWDLYQRLRHELMAMEAVLDAAVASDYAQAGIRLESMWDVYRHTWLPFGGLLTDMEAVGMAVDRAHLAAAQQQAEADQAQAQERFRRWASSRVGDAKYMNVGSGAQVQQLLFAGAANALSQGSKGVDKPPLPLERVFKVPNVDGLKNEGDKRAKKNLDITLHGVWGRGAPSPLKPEVYTAGGLPACSTPVLKSLAGKAGKARKKLAELGLDKPGEDLSGLRGMLDVAEEEEEGVLGLEEEGEEEEWEVDDEKILQAQREMQQKNQQLEDAMAPKSQQELEALAAKEGYGRLFSAFSSVAEGLYACDAVDSLVDASAIDTLLSNFIVPLQSDDISKPDPSGVYRVHCSLNINTETGRLSARRPNLQNQPALEKDRYKVRKAFRADVAAGKTLVVADYGQLELRILAHMANCRSMIEAFEMGGDFHSRTALGMYDHIKEAIAREQCLLEWEGEGEPPLPLLKDMFASERRKAKVLNFSIAYGKTAHGLSKDWKVTIQEAEDTVKRWYESRPEVQKWQKERREDAVTKGYVTTILGRRRQLPDARNTRNKAAQGHALRAAINTPIQGSAADIATAAMLRIAADPELREMGWRLLLQVHDEVILEGPKETAEQARARVVACMRSPFSGLSPKPLLVDLVVDAKHADTWYEAK